MKKWLAIIILALLLCDTPLTLAMWPFGPSNYEECIAKEMKGVSSDVAARAIITSCRKRFPITKKQKKAGTKMPQEETSKVTGTLQSSYSGYTANIYNGASWTLTDLFINISTVDSNRMYRVPVEIEPLTADSISFNATKESEFVGWYIVEVWGYR